uniref:Uncharacterized protein n=1 Tax=Anguilla anguilla TaxID=7936 RepID=A0A0E9UMX8_ANGAN
MAAPLDSLPHHFFVHGVGSVKRQN